MTMNDDAIISLEEASAITGRAKSTINDWRYGHYYRKGVGELYYFDDKRKLSATKIKGIWWFKLKDIVEWNRVLNDRLGRWRRSK